MVRRSSRRVSSAVLVAGATWRSVSTSPVNRPCPMKASVYSVPDPPVDCVVTSRCTSATVRSRTQFT